MFKCDQRHTSIFLLLSTKEEPYAVHCPLCLQCYETVGEVSACSLTCKDTAQAMTAVSLEMFGE